MKSQSNRSKAHFVAGLASGIQTGNGKQFSSGPRVRSGAFSTGSGDEQNVQVGSTECSRSDLIAREFDFQDDLAGSERLRSVNSTQTLLI